jgi:hypothetical protein
VQCFEISKATLQRATLIPAFRSAAELPTKLEKPRLAREPEQTKIDEAVTIRH